MNQSKLSPIEDRGQTDCVTALPRAGHWSLTLTYDLDFQSQASWDVHPHKKMQVQRSVGSVNRVKTDGLTLSTASPSWMTRSVTHRQTWSSWYLSLGLKTRFTSRGVSLGTWGHGDSVFVTHEAWNWDKIENHSLNYNDNTVILP